MLFDVVTAYVTAPPRRATPRTGSSKRWDALKTLYPISIDHHDLLDSDAIGEPGELTRGAARRAHRGRRTGLRRAREQIEEIAAGRDAQLERNVLLNVVDRKWREHLYEMDYLKEGINLRAVAQKDPVVEYQREGYDMFSGMLDAMKEEAVGFLFNVTVEANPQRPQRRWHPSPRRPALPSSRPGRSAGAGRRRRDQGTSGAARHCAPRELTTTPRR